MRRSGALPSIEGAGALLLQRPGRVLASGTPEEISAVESSYTGRYLRHVLKRARKARVGRRVKTEVSAAV